MLKRTVPLLLLCLLWSGWAVAEGLTIGRMRVSVWPEFDDPGVLVTYDGRFSDAAAFPTKTSFFVPKNILISDACSLSPDGQHFCQIYRTSDRGAWNEVELWLPFPNFYLSFHMAGPDLGSEQRHFDYRIRLNHPVEVLELDVQQPLRAEAFTITPGGAEASEKNGFNHFGYRLEGLKPGEERVFAIAYRKADAQPSIDIKYSPMSGPKVWGSPDSARKNTGIYIQALFGSGLLTLLGLLWLLFRKKRPGPS